MSDRSAVQTESLELMKRICARDSAALRRLYELHSSLLFAIAIRMLRDRGDAEQLLIDVFMEVWQHGDRYDANRSSPSSYLILLTRSRALDRLRARREPTVLLPTDAAQPVDTARTPFGRAVDSEQNELIQVALAKLSDDEREAVEMSFLDGLSHAQIAEKLHKPLGTVKTHVRQGIIHLRSALRIILKGDQDRL